MNFWQMSDGIRLHHHEPHHHDGYRGHSEPGAAWLDLRARGRIIARGRDRARFLHNVTSNDVKKMTPGQAAYAFLLTPQGRIQADLWLVCYEDHFLIDTLPELVGV